MLRIFLFVVTVGVLLGLGAMVYIGTYPPNPPTHQVEKTLPTTSLGH